MEEKPRDGPDSNGKETKWWQLWPIFLLPSVYLLSYFNPDYLITPLLIKYNFFSKAWVLFVVGLVGFLEMWGGYLGWSGLRGLVERWLRDDIEFVKKIKGEQKTQDFIEWLKIRFTRKYLKLIDDKNYYNEPASKVWLVRNINKIGKALGVVIKSSGYIGIFLASITPIPGFRVIPDVFCGTTRWKKGFLVLAIGNFLKTIAFVYGWGRVLK